jgi:membrane-associated phospholipid phosphatase
VYGILAVALWPVGIAALCGLGAVLAWRGASSAHVAEGMGSAVASERDDSPVMRIVLRFLLVVAAGTAAIYAVMLLLAWLAEHFGPHIDKPIFAWTISRRVPAWEHLMHVATQAGGKYPTTAIAGIAAIALAATWHSNRWLPPLALVSLVLIEHFLTIAIDQTIHRPPPPGSEGTFPSGGTARAVAIYGLIAYLLWREFSGRRKAGIWAAVLVAVLGFNEAYSRGYLAVHWFTDILGGLLYGCLLLGLFIAAVQVTAGPVKVPPLREPAPAHPAPARAPTRSLQ